MSLLSKALSFAVRAAEGDAEKGVARRAATMEAQNRRLAIKRAAAEVQPLPRPAQPLLLPKPAPKSLAAKPRGGQWYPNETLVQKDAQLAGYRVADRGPHAHRDARFQVVRPTGEGSATWPTAEDALRSSRRENAQKRSRDNHAPERTAAAARDSGVLIDWVPEGETPSGPGPGAQLGNWLEKAYTKYLRNDFGSPQDPLRDLASRGLHYDPEMTPDRWLSEANDHLMADPIGRFTVPRHESDIIEANTSGLDLPGLPDYAGESDPRLQGALMQAAPWLRKQPATDNIYGVRGGGPDIGHFIDEMRNAINPADSGLPADLAVRPESLGRMSFPQAAEHVGKINQWRAKQMEAAAAARMDNPAIHPFKEYPDAPGGLRWVQLKLPEAGEDLGGYRIAEEPNIYSGGVPGHVIYDPTGKEINVAKTREDALRHIQADRYRGGLSEALQQEGDAMGHCVGGYCDDVIGGSSNIFSLRDAKGMPHATIETSPKAIVYSDIVRAAGKDQADAWLDQGLGVGAMADLVGRDKISGQDIVQIKGKQNRAPNDEYLPYVQDFVKSQKWGKIGDINNAQLARLPGERYIDQGALNDIVKSNNLDDLYQSYDFTARGFPQDPSRMSPEDWAQFSHHFEGYKRGGLVVKRGCGCAKCNTPFAVRAA